MASSENPMLLLETPQGPSGRQRGWNPELGDLSGLPRHASSCPATPQDTLHQSRGGPHVREAFPLTDARSEQPKADTWYETSGKMKILHLFKNLNILPGVDLSIDTIGIRSGSSVAT